jgi:hypothetical protein
MKSFVTHIVALSVIFSVSLAWSDGEDLDQVSKTTQKEIAGALGNVDPVVPHRLARKIAPRQLVAAFYKGTRAERLLALDAAAGYSEDPWSLLPSLAALMGARERQVASRATNSLLILLERWIKRPDQRGEIVIGQVKQLANQLIPLAADIRLDTDVRISAMNAIRILQQVGAEPIHGQTKELLKAGDLLIRRAAIAGCDPPIDDQLLPELVQIVIGDPDFGLRGETASVLCENALIHGVKEPSSDLKKLIEGVIKDARVPAEALAPVLICIKQYPVAVQADFADLAKSRGDPAIDAFWENLNKKIRK